MRTLILIGLTFIFSNAYSQSNEEIKRTLLGKWEAYKFLINGEENRNMHMDEVMIFKDNMTMKVYGKWDEKQEMAKTSSWHLNKSADCIIVDKGTKGEFQMKIVNLNRKELIYTVELDENTQMMVYSSKKK